MDSTTLFKGLISCFFISLGSFVLAQSSSDCIGAIPVCDEIYIETNSPTGEGNVVNEINSTFGGGFVCCDFEDNSTWYTFTVDNSGDLGFSIIPNDVDDDYDWALFNITDAECGDLYDNPDLMVSCNASGGVGCHGETGATGDSEFDLQGAGCNFTPPSVSFGFSPFNDLIPVLEGETYVLYISNWTGSTAGYTLDFSSSEGVGIYDVVPPEIADAIIPDCPLDIIELFFTEEVDCNTVDSTSFVLEGPGGSFDLQIVASACANGGSTTNFLELTIMGSPGTGDYQLIVNNSDSLSFLDKCGNPIFSDTFNVSYLVPVLDIGPDTAICMGQVLTLQTTLTDVEYLWSTNETTQTIEVTEPGTYSLQINDGCFIRSDTLEVEVLDAGMAGIFELPGAFTPNNDELNDRYNLAYEDVEFQEFRMEIWNRWGEKIFETDDPTMGWDGRFESEAMPSDVYVCLMEAKIIDCFGEISDRKEKREFTLIR